MMRQDRRSPADTSDDQHDGTVGAVRGETPRGRVFVVNAQPLIATGLQYALGQCGWEVHTSGIEPECEVVLRAGQFGADCVLLDVDRGHGIGPGMQLIRPLSSTGAKVVMFTAERRRAVLAECLEAGAVGWIPKDLELCEVDSRLSLVVDGRSLVGRTERAELLERLRTDRAQMLRSKVRFDQLTPREAGVLCALADGLSAEEIARHHHVALTTVRSQIRSVLQKLGVRTQLAAVAAADAHWWLLPPEARPARDRRRATAADGAAKDQRAARTA